MLTLTQPSGGLIQQINFQSRLGTSFAITGREEKKKDYATRTIHECSSGDLPKSKTKISLLRHIQNSQQPTPKIIAQGTLLELLHFHPRFEKNQFSKGREKKECQRERGTSLCQTIRTRGQSQMACIVDSTFTLQRGQLGESPKCLRTRRLLVIMLS